MNRFLHFVEADEVKTPRRGLFVMRDGGKFFGLALAVTWRFAPAEAFDAYNHCVLRRQREKFVYAELTPRGKPRGRFIWGEQFCD